MDETMVWAVTITVLSALWAGINVAALWAIDIME